MASGLGEARQLRRLEVGGDPVGGLDGHGDAVGQRRRQREAAVDGLQQPVLERLVVDADGGLERADEVADHVFGRIVQQRGQPPAARQVRLHGGGDLLHRRRRLRQIERRPRHSRCQRLAEAVGDVLYLDVLGRGIEQVEAAARQHALPAHPGRTGGSVRVLPLSVMRGLRRRLEGALQIGAGFVAMAGDEVIVDHAGRLHEGIDRGGADETEAFRLQPLEMALETEDLGQNGLEALVVAVQTAFKEGMPK